MNNFIKNFISYVGNVLFFFNKKDIKKENIKKILIISLYFRGDVLFNTVAIKMLNKIFRDALIDVLVKSRSKEVLEGSPYINKLIVFDDIKTADYNDSSKIKLKEKFLLIKKIRNENYDLCIDFTGKYSTALFTLLGGFKYSTGLNYNGFGFCYSKFVNIDTQNTAGHLTEKYLHVVKEGLGIDVNEWAELKKNFTDNCEIYINEPEIKVAAKQLDKLYIHKERPLVCIQVTAGWKAKELSENNFTALIKKLISSEYSFILIGSDEDKEINYRILDAAGSDLRKYYLNLPLKVNAAVIRLSDVFIGSDSIGLHLAGALGTPSVGLFGPTNPTFSNPAGDKHLIIYHQLFCSAPDNHQYCTRDAGKSCPTIDCMKLIHTEEIFKKIEFLLRKYSRQKQMLFEKN
ncbi:MAG: glycosyltransferase family 9 protein [Bacteroidota bacterium]|nr:glycosyltransferase family 9 protein [Bacteroidota bacterium]